MNPMTEGVPAGPIRGGIRRWLPLLLILLGIVLFFAFGLQRYLTGESLCANRTSLDQIVGNHYWLALAIFVLVYAMVVALSVPGGLALTLAGGYLFGPWVGGGATILGATTGAGLLFLAAHGALADWLRGRAGPWLERMREGFQANAFSYLLFLRLVPAFPFFIVNLVPAFLGVEFRVFLFATVIGIAPATFIFSNIGAGLGKLLDCNKPISIGAVLSPETIAGLVGLALLALLPVAYKKWRRR
jgi:uncharacterized membrane protein YdjX (TVP38/TMEM64 family)